MLQGSAVHRPAPPVADPGARSRVFWLSLLFALAMLALVARLTPMLRGGGLGGVGGYDDGVYYTAATALVNGRLPYASFLLLHPPGILLVLAPFAWLGSHTSDATGFAVARVVFMLIGALSTVLIAHLLRRFGLAAAVVGGVFYAVFFPAVYAERSTLLEPVGTLAILVALALLQPAGGARSGRRSAWLAYLAGGALGAAAGVKIWYVVAVLVIAAAQRGRARWRVLLGAVVGAAVVCGPFFVAAPTRMIRYVLSDQLGRAEAHVSVVERLESIVGLDRIGAADSATSMTLKASLVVMLLVLIGCAIVAATQTGARLFVALLAAHVVVLLASPSYYTHYSTLTASPLALVVGVAAGRVVAGFPRPLGRQLMSAAAVVAALAYGIPGVLHPTGTSFPAAGLRPAAARVAGCVVADDPTALVELDVLTSDLRRGCVIWPDVTGWLYDTPPALTSAGTPTSRPGNPVWQRAVGSYLQSGAAVILIRPGTGLRRSTRATVERGPVLARAGGFALHATAR